MLFGIYAYVSLKYVIERNRTKSWKKTKRVWERFCFHLTKFNGKF